MKKNVIFYFSGTGNSYQVARDLSDNLGECEVIPIVNYKEKKIAGYESVGIVFPTYFWGAPNIVKKFFEETQVSGETYIYAVATCGGTQGASLHQINDRLKKQGRRLDAGFRIIMPENYILMYDATSPEKQKEIFDDEKVLTKDIANLVRRKEKKRLGHGRYVVDALFGRLVNESVVSKYADKDKGFVLNNDCTGCGRCVKACSMNNIVLTDGKPIWQHHCEFCLGCLQSCPKQAINWKQKTQKRNRYINPILRPVI